MTEEKQKAQFQGNIFDLQIFQTFGNLETRFDINLSKYLSSLKFLKLYFFNDFRYFLNELSDIISEK